MSKMAMKSFILVFFSVCVFLSVVTEGATVDPQVADDRKDADPVRKRRAYQRISTLGDYLYIEGGEIANWYSGDDNHDPVNATYSIPLNKEWTQDDVELREIKYTDDRHSASYAALWKDDKANKLYRWAGEAVRRNATDDDRVLWEFSPDAKGGGAWKKTEPKAIANLNMTGQGASTSCDGFGYYLSGWANIRTQTLNDPGGQGTMVPGMLVWNMEKQTYENITSANSYSYTGTSKSAQAICVSGVWDSPLIFIVGGVKPNTLNPRDTDKAPMSTIDVFNVTSKEWFQQELTTEGTLPEKREDFCIIGVQGKVEPGKVKTYDIIMFGGIVDSADDLNDVWVLSLPAFRWFKTQAQSPKRRHQSCVLSGKSEMISIGGMVTGDRWGPLDEWRYGVGVLDLNTMNWTHKHQPDSPEYVPLQEVTKWYSDGNLGKMTWSDKMNNFFTKTSSSSDPETSKPSKPPSTSATSSPPAPSSSSAVSKGAIAGGVVGGLGGLAIITSAVWLLLRRRRRRSDDENDDEHLNAGHGHIPTVAPAEMHGNTSDIHEALGSEVVEAPSTRHASISAGPRSSMGVPSTVGTPFSKTEREPSPAPVELPS